MKNNSLTKNLLKYKYQEDNDFFLTYINNNIKNINK